MTSINLIAGQADLIAVGGDAMMSPEDQRFWCEMLSPGRPSQQASIIRELLANAKQDHMSKEDRIVCARQLRRLDKEALK